VSLEEDGDRGFFLRTEDVILSFVYLASPYTPTEGESIHDRFTWACRAAAYLMREGVAVFSPIAHSHPVADFLEAEIRFNHDAWMRQDLPILSNASRLVVLTLPGWERSRGVTAEIAHAQVCGIPLEYLPPDVVEGRA
jgi:hypothetical protein